MICLFLQPVWSDEVELQGLGAIAGTSSSSYAALQGNIEQIDLRTGSMDFFQDALSIPGNGGMALNLGWKLTRKHYWFDKPAIWDTPHGELGNWQLSIPKLVINSANSAYPNAAPYNRPNNEFCTAASANRLPVLLIGRTSVSFARVDASSPSYLPTAAKYVSTSLWYIECPTSNAAGQSVFKVVAPNGTNYYFDVWGGDDRNGFNIQSEAYASNVVDVNGNSIIYAYGPTLSQSEGNETISTRQLQSISTSDGRSVQFGYLPGQAGVQFQSIPRLDSISVGNKVWQFGYTTFVGPANKVFQELHQVTNPDGTQWVYGYSGYPRVNNVQYRHVTSINSPLGATWTYGYVAALRAQGSGKSFSGTLGTDNYYALQLKTLSGPRINTAQWSYSYAFEYTTSPYPDFHRQRTRIVGPDRAQEFVYSVSLEYGAPNYYNVVETGIYPPSVNWSDPQYLASALQREFFTRVNGAVVSNGPGVSQPSEAQNWIRLRIPAVLSSKTVADYQSNVSFVTNYSDVDAYNNPRTIVESGNDGSRTTRRTFFTNTARWLISLPESETVDGYAGVSRDYDDFGRVMRLSSYGVEQTFEYHASGDLWKKKWRRDALGPQIQVVFEDYYRGQARLETRPLGDIIHRVINPSGTVASDTNGRGYTTSYQYDVMDQLTLIDYPVHSDVIISWTSPTERILTRGAYREKRTYDAAGNLSLLESEDTNRQGSKRYLRKTHDPVTGSVLFRSRVSDDANETRGIQTSYDPFGRALSTMDTATGATRTFCYGTPCNTARPGRPAVGFGFVSLDAEGYEQVSNYRAFGDPSSKELMNVSEQVDASPARYITTSIARDLLGNMRTLSRGGLTREYIYNSNNLLWKIVEPEHTTVEFGYDLQGNKTTSRTGTAAATTFVYDDLNRVDWIDYPVGTADVDFGYDENGNLMTASNGVSSWTYGYDEKDNLKSEKLNIDGREFLFGYEIGDLDRITHITYPSGVGVDFAPDAFGRPHQVGAYVSSIDYYANDQVHTMQFGNGVVSTFTPTVNDLLDTAVTTKGGVLVSGYDYAYDLKRNPTSIADLARPARTKTLHYDGVARLVAASGEWGSGSISYDDLDNIAIKNIGASSLSYHYDAATNRLGSISGSSAYSFAYDADGNLTSDGVMGFAFNSAAQMTAVTSIAGSSFAYDGNGMRVKQMSQDGSTYYVYSRAGLLLLSLDTSKSSTSEYFYRNNVLVARRDYGAGVNPDHDGDGIPDHIERAAGMDANSASDAAGDVDGDGLSNLSEYLAGTYLTHNDSDGDGMSDYYEVRYGLNPLAADGGGDNDSDGLTNLQEAQLGTNPLDADTDNDGLSDSQDPKPRFNPAILAPIFQILLD